MDALHGAAPPTPVRVETVRSALSRGREGAARRASPLIPGQGQVVANARSTGITAVHPCDGGSPWQHDAMSPMRTPNHREAPNNSCHLFETDHDVYCIRIDNPPTLNVSAERVLYVVNQPFFRNVGERQERT